MGELERVYSASRTSGGTRDAVQKALEELCAKGILEREQKAGQWMYKATVEFDDRVKKA
jgi:DNA-binding GntR family transcriptional regulator